MTSDAFKRISDPNYRPTVPEIMACVTEEEAEVLKVLWSVGLHPGFHPTLIKAATGVAGIVKALRDTLADPPPDVQELVMEKLGVHRSLLAQAELTEAMTNAIREALHVLEMPRPEDPAGKQCDVNVAIAWLLRALAAKRLHETGRSFRVSPERWEKIGREALEETAGEKPLAGAARQGGAT